MAITLTVATRLPDIPWTNIPLANGWVYYGDSFQATPQYCRHNGVVILKGLVKNGSMVGDVGMGTLPVGCRPALQLHRATIANLAFAAFGITQAGTLTYKTGSNLWFSFDGTSFVAEQ